MAEKKKIMILVHPASGHVNPMCGLVYELCKQKDTEVIFYSVKKLKDTVEKTGAIYRNFCKEFTPPPIHINEQRLGINVLLNRLVSTANHILPQLISEVENEKPDLIIYDGFFLVAKYLLEVLKKRNAHRVPKSVMFIPQFVYTERVIQIMREHAKENLWSKLSILPILKDQIYLNWKFGMSVYNPLKLFIAINDHLNVVGVIPELQPNIEEFDSTFKFVGSCISEDVRSVERYQDDKELESFINQFEPKEIDSEIKSDLKLIYMSLGTIFNANFFIYETVIEAIKILDQQSENRSSELRVIISVGDFCFKQFDEKISSGEFQLPENILIRAKVPQLEILKRADLFITHCGMNSTNEAIKYAVPIIGLPLEGDQPMVAKRVCDEMSIGIRFDPLKINSDELAIAINRILNEDSFKKNITNLSHISAKYNGPVDGAKVIMDYLNQ